MNSRGSAVTNVLVVFVVILLAALVALNIFPRTGHINLTTPYQAVLLDTGQVYFGRLEQADSPYPVLRDVYYVQSGVNPGTKEVANVLLKRGKEWHSPDHMILNAHHIVMIEPVSPDSKVAQLIAELKK